MSYFRITREAFDPYVNDPLGNFGRYTKYEAWDDEKMIGQLFFKNIISTIIINGEEFRIIKPNRFLKTFPREVFSTTENKKIAELHYSVWNLSFWNWNMGTIRYANDRYKCSSDSPSVIKTSLLSDNQQVSQTVTIASANNTMLLNMIYNRSWSAENSPDRIIPKSGFSGHFTGDGDPLLLFLGLYLVERYFNRH